MQYELELLRHTPAKPKKGAPPLLFVHGAWHGAWCWEEHFLPYFAERGFDVYALSLRGHGASSGREGLRWHSIKNYVDDVQEVIGRLPASPVLIGHSMGGLIVQKYLERAAVPGAVLLAPVPTEGVWRTVLRLLGHDPAGVLLVLSRLSLGPLVRSSRWSREHFFSKDVSPADLERYHGLMQSESFRALVDMLVLALPRPKRVHSVPMLVLGAADDTIFRPPQIRRTASRYGAALRIFEDMAHDMMLERDHKAVADVMLQWMQEHV